MSKMKDGAQSKTSSDVVDGDVSDKSIESIIREAQESGCLGYSNDPDDSIWIGEDGNLDPGDWLYDHLGPKHPLENILLPIIFANLSDEQKEQCEGNSRRRSKILGERLNAALRALVGFTPSSGPIDHDQLILREIADAYWVELADPFLKDNRPIFSEIAARILKRNGVLERVDTRILAKDLIDRLRKKFSKQKEALLKVASSKTAPEQESRHRNEQTILKLLEELGVRTKNFPD